MSLMLAGASDSAISGESQPELFEDSELTIVTAENHHYFNIEVARSGRALARGLMERRSLANDAGMLFDFGTSRQINMWMKNTYIPLDMLFIERTGKIVGIATNTVPFSTTVIPSPGPVPAVLELNAGTVSRLRINVGDQVLHGIFSP